MNFTPNILPMISVTLSPSLSHSTDSFAPIERVANQLVGAAFSPHRHDTYTVALTTAGYKRSTISGRSWLDREWSSRYLGGAAIGWDWTGLNFDDGTALMAFRIRAANGGNLWAGGTFRRANGTSVTLEPGDIAFTPMRTWRSKRTGATYPVAQILTIKLPEGLKRLTLTPMFADQELDARSSGLSVYWEGLVRTKGGRGYLELTGYAAPLAM